MKHVRMPLAIVAGLVFAIAGSAFKKAETSLYWFPDDTNGNPQPVSTLLLEPASSNPYGCTNAAITRCTSGYTSYTTNSAGQFIPAGSLAATLTKAN